MDAKLRDFDGFVAGGGAFQNLDMGFANFKMFSKKFYDRLVGFAVMGLFAGADNKLTGSGF